MTNAEIVCEYKLTHNIPLEAPLYTYAVWLKKGYKVKRGAVSHHVPMWGHSNRPTKAQREAGQETGDHCFHKMMYLFGADQVEKVTG